MQDRDDFEARSTAVKQLLSDHGQALVHATVNACVFCLPSYMVPDVAEVLYELMLINLPVSSCIGFFFLFILLKNKSCVFRQIYCRNLLEYISCI